jgi:uncharacterized protein (TIGR00369 family)
MTWRVIAVLREGIRFMTSRYLIWIPSHDAVARGSRRHHIGKVRNLTDDYKTRLLSHLNASPFLAHLEMVMTELGYGTATFAIGRGAFRMQPYGVMHGGNVATLIDSATFWACFVAMGTDEDALTSVDLAVKYLAPARNEPLACTARMLKAGKTLFLADAEVRADDGRLIAHGTSTLMRLPGLGLRLGIPMFAA